MEEVLKNIWRDALKHLEGVVGKLSFETYLKRVKPVYLENSTVTLEVPNNITKDWIQSKYLKTIEDVFSNTLKKQILVDFTIEERKEKREEELPRLHFKEQLPQSRLNPKYTFENFVVGDSNNLSFAAATAVAGAPGKAYNPLLIYGGVGLGKTHLMQAIGHYILANHKRLHLSYVTCETFTNEFISAIQENKTEAFRNQYRTKDVLLIDDIQFIIKTEKTQEEFFHTFNTLFEANKQIVITSDRPVREFTQLEERLKSRIGWGLCVDIQLPDIETRIAILQKKCARDNVNISDNFLYSIAQQFSSNIREMEGALNRIIAEVEVNKLELNDDSVKEILRDIIPTFRSKVMSIDKIKEVVAQYFNLSVSEITSQRRLKNLTYPRQLAMFLCRELTNNTLSKVGEEFGNRDHTTVLHAYDKIQKEIKENTDTERIYQELCNSLKVK